MIFAFIALAFKSGSKASALACGAAFVLLSGCASADVGPFFPAWDRINPNQSAMRMPEDPHYRGPIGSVGPKVKPRSEPPGCPLYDDSGVIGWSLGCPASSNPPRRSASAGKGI